ncbi:MAG: ABC transporter substrate-binding protein [Syntrophales bacterium]
MKYCFRISAFITIAALIMLAGIPAQGASGQRELRIADGTGDWGYPNPFGHYPRGPGYVRMSWVFDTLVWKDQKGYIPALADSWKYDPAAMTFTFHLNPRAKWHDGKPVMAEDVVFTIGYYRKHPYRFIKTTGIGAVSAKGARTVLIKLAKPYAPFLSDIGGTMPILPKHVWESVADPEKYLDPKAFIGSGPYQFRDFDKTGGSYLYEAFPDYYQGPPQVERLIYVRSGKPLISLTTGEADLANIQPEMGESLVKKGMKVISDERGWVKKLLINHHKKPLSDKRFRQALAYLIDQKEIVEQGHRGFATLASYGLLSIDHDMYNPGTPTYLYDLQKASRLIEALGFKRGKDGFFQKDGKKLKLALLSSNIAAGGESVADRDGEIIKRQLEKGGIAVELVNMEQATTDGRIKKWDFELAISGHGGIAGDPVILNEMISSVYGGGSVTSARYDDNAALNKLLEKSLVEMDQVKRKEIVYQIQKIYAQELPAIPLYYPQTKAAYNPRKGVDWFYTKGGIAKGIPLPQNKLSLIKR